MSEIEELEHEHRLLRARNERLEKELEDCKRALGSVDGGGGRADCPVHAVAPIDFLTRVHEALRGTPRKPLTDEIGGKAV